MKLCYPPKMNEKNDTQQKGTISWKEMDHLSTGLIFSGELLLFVGGIWSLYLVILFSHRLYKIHLRQYTIHQFTVVFLDCMIHGDASQKLADLCFQVLGVWLPDATAQPELGIWEWWIRTGCEWSHVLSVFTRILKKKVQRRIKWCFKVWKKGCLLCVAVSLRYVEPLRVGTVDFANFC